MKDKNSLLATGSLIGTIIGAGVFGIPYVIAKSGVFVSLFYFLILGFIVLFLHLFFGEIVLRSGEKHRLVGYTEKYLGKKAKILVTLSVILGTIGALLAYIILGGKFLKIVLPFSFSVFQFTLILWAGLSFFVFWGIRSIAPFELLMNIGLFGAFMLIFIFCFPKIETSNFLSFNKTYLFLPFGIFLFSLIGWNAVPEIEGILTKKASLKKVILYSIIISTIFYFLFGLIVSGVTGSQTTKEPFSGLLPFLGNKIIVLGGIFGLLAVSTSFLVLANYLKNTLFLDYHLPYLLSFLLAVFLPLSLFLAGIREFIPVIAFVGTFVGLIEGVVISLIYKKAKKIKERTPAYILKVPDFLIYLTIVILILGTLSQIIYYFG